MAIQKSLLLAILTHMDFSNDVYSVELIASADWMIPSVAVLCLVVVIAKCRK